MANNLDKGYNGNLNLKRNNTPIEWTPELLAEYVRCAQDPIYFAERYIKIVHVDHGFIPIRLYDYQKDIIESYQNNRRTIVLTSRQAGKTTVAACLILHFVLFNPHKLVALLANKGDSAREILDRIQKSYEGLPKWLQQGVIEWNKGSVSFENGSKIIAAATSSSAIRGKSVALLYIDECAFVENWDEFYASVFPTITSGQTTKILFTSTPNGLNHYYKFWTGAHEKGDDYNGFNPISVHWNRVPGRGEEWRKETLASLNFDMDKFRQEFECEFLGSSGTLIAGWKLKELHHTNPVQQRGGMFKYEEVQEGHIYVTVADVSRGKGLDYSAFIVFDVTEMPYRQVFVFRDNMTNTIDYANILHNILKYYNDSYALIEINDIGQQVADLLCLDLDYEQVLYTANKGRTGKIISQGFSPTVDRGIRTTKTVKSIGCSIIKMMVEQNKLHICDWHTIHELATFSKKGQSYEAEPGCHDDLAMCLVLFGWLSDQQFFKELANFDLLAHMRERTDEELMEDLLPFGIINDGRDNDDELSEEFKPAITIGGERYW